MLIRGIALLSTVMLTIILFLLMDKFVNRTVMSVFENSTNGLDSIK
jgi:hypothetical protein